MKKNLRSGYTTGACAAAAAKAATWELLSYESGVTSFKKNKNIEIPFPDGSRVEFKVHNSKPMTLNSERTARASVIKDAGDDPDVTHGTEIVAEVRVKSLGSRVKGGKLITHNPELLIKGGKGVGTVTKPGLAVPAGEPAINPVPRKMIEEAVREAIKESQGFRDKGYELENREGLQFQTLDSILQSLEITISVPGGEELAKKTLNARLGIIGGISILGTTGIVKPVSTDAWTATISSSMDVAKATGCKEVVLSAGRTSEKAHMKRYHLPDESYVLMGDYLEYALRDARDHRFKKIHICAQWAKMLKIAMTTPQTHVRFGAINIGKAVEFLSRMAVDLPDEKEFNTAREIFDYINSRFRKHNAKLFRKVCDAARDYAEEITGSPGVKAYLVSYEKEIIAESE